MNSQKIPVIFVLGSGHCGSTLLDMLLGSHSKIFGAGELKELGREQETICTCGRKVEKCPFWLSVMEETKIEFSRSNNPVAAQEQLYKNIARVSGAYSIVDSSKLPERAMFLDQSKIIQPILLHLVRDGRAVVWSYYRKYKRLFPFMWHWFILNIKIELLKMRTGLPSLFIWYGDLVASPQRELTRILDRINLSFEPAMLNFRAHEHHQVEGNRMRFGESGEIKEDNDWKGRMPIWQRTVFNFLFGWLNVYYRRKSRNKQFINGKL